MKIFRLLFLALILAGCNLQEEVRGYPPIDEPLLIVDLKAPDIFDVVEETIISGIDIYIGENYSGIIKIDRTNIKSIKWPKGFIVIEFMELQKITLPVSERR